MVMLVYGVALLTPGVTAAGTNTTLPLALRTTDRFNAASISILNRPASSSSSDARLAFVPSHGGAGCHLQGLLQPILV